MKLVRGDYYITANKEKERECTREGEKGRDNFFSERERNGVL